MNHNASTSGSREWWDTDHMNKYKGNIKNNCVYESSYHLEKHGPWILALLSIFLFCFYF